MAKYLALFSLTGETIKRFIAKPSDRAAVVQELAESVGGSLESYYWTFGRYDGAAVIVMPDSHTLAVVNLAIISSGAFTRFETHELMRPTILPRSPSVREGSPTRRRAPDRDAYCPASYAGQYALSRSGRQFGYSRISYGPYGLSGLEPPRHDWPGVPSLGLSSP